MGYYVYILYSTKRDSYYVGHSGNPWRREKEHQESEGRKYTGSSDDWKLKATFYASKDRESALRMERFIKQQKSRRLIEKLIDPSFKPTGKLAQLVRVSHVRD